MLPTCFSISQAWRPRRAIVPVALVLGVLLAPAVHGADAKPLDADVLKKVKAGTAYLQVKLKDGRVLQGSGFFADEPGLIVTNAHVLNMLDADSRKPLAVAVIVTDAAGNSRALPAKVIGVDRGSDLGVIRVEGKDLPEPLKLGKTSETKETDSVYVFGFPFGKDLGKEITVSRSSVSAVRKTGNFVQTLQLDGGLNPGNSGGPVVDDKGNVVGVAVSGVRGTQIGFAIPAEFVGKFLGGRIIGSSVEVPIKEKDSDELKLPITFELVDPLGRIKKMEVEVWTGNAGDRRPSSTKEPEALAGDSAKKRFDMKYDKTKPTVSMDVPVPALTDPKQQVYWIRPVITDGQNETLWVMATIKKPQPPLERKPIALKYRPPTGGKQTADLVSLGGFKIRTDDGPDSSAAMNFRTSITEHFGETEAGGFPMRITYDRISLGIKIDDKPLRDPREVQALLKDFNLMAGNVEMDGDGSVAGSTADLTRVPQASRDGLSDISDQALEALELLSIPLPDHRLEPRETWKAHRNFQIGSGIIAVEAQGNLVYTYRGVQVRDGKDVVLIGFEGRIRGKRGDAGSVGGTVTGAAVLNPETGVVIHADANVKADVDFTFGRRPARATGTLAVSVDRPAAPAKGP